MTIAVDLGRKATKQRNKSRLTNEPYDYFILSLIVAQNACFALSGVNKSVFGINK